MALFKIHPKKDETNKYKDWKIILQDLPFLPDFPNSSCLIHSEPFNVYERVRGQPYELDALAWEIGSALESIENELPPEHRRDLQRTFADFEMINDSTFLSVEQQPGVERSEQRTVYAAFYKGLHLYLNREDRVNAFHARYANLFAVWQWFNLIKRLLGSESKPGPGRWNDELAQAHQTLLELVKNERYAQQLRWLAKKGNFELESGPLLRENILLSLALQQKKLEDKEEYNKPLLSPGCSKNLKGLRSLCGNVELHPWLASADTGGQQAVRKIISNHLLTGYDLSASFHLARLLHHGTVRRFIPFWQANLAGLIAVALLVFGCSFASQSWPAAPYWVLAGFQFVLGFIAVVLLTIKGIGYQSLQHFLFPRLLGGVLIGYLAIILESDSVSLRAALWQRGLLGIVGLWLGIGALGLGYLFFDTLPLVGKWKIALTRAGEMLLLALSASLLVGLFVLPVFTAAFSDHYVFGLLILGPMGYLSLWDLLAFAPVALFTGLVTQFIFERETITSSVWSAERE